MPPTTRKKRKVSILLSVQRIRQIELLKETYTYSESPERNGRLVKKTSFTFKYHVTKSFPLKGCKTGYYRVKATFSGSKLVNTTNSFKINR